MEIYMVSISCIDKEELDFISSFIDIEKRCIIDKLINEKDKIRSTIADILVRSIIIKKLNIRNKYIKFEKNQYGKPYLAGYSNFKFNISHSGNFVVCAIDDKSIGVDIEEVKNIEYKDIVNNFFSVNECNYIVKQDINSRLDEFYNMWVLKESYIKCCGKGLSIPLDSFSINIEKYNNIKVMVDSEYKKYKFKKFDIDLDYKMAVCSLSSKICDNIININQTNLLNAIGNFF